MKGSGKEKRHSVRMGSTAAMAYRPDQVNKTPGVSLISSTARPVVKFNY